MTARSGSTLLELVVALAVLGITAGVAGVALRATDDPDPAAVRAAQVSAARRSALEARRAVPFILADGGPAGVALPDGRVLLADSALDVDPLTGRPRAAR
ncbi:MAG TPA: type II secretion system protein [Longimicrobium sp.]|jgi:prepilin-type N-terminal cleavage/methylation domain-containing protein